MALERHHIAELYSLYHLARTALSGQSPSKYDRKLWATREFCKLYPAASNKQVYLTFERADAGLC